MVLVVVLVPSIVLFGGTGELAVVVVGLVLRLIDEVGVHVAGV